MYISMSDRTGGQKNRQDGAPPAGPNAMFRLSPVIIWLGIVSMMTDISSESVSAILPLYITGFLGLSTIAFGIIDGINQGASAIVRIGAGWVSDRTGHPKRVAVAGYGLSMVARIGFLFAGGFWAIAGVVTGDRIGKGIRTAPRDAMISEAAQPDYLARSFGVHRMLDNIGAAAGPLIAFLVLLAIPNGFSTVFVVSLAFSVIGVAVLVLMVPGRERRERRAQASAGRLPQSFHGSGLHWPGLHWSALRWSRLREQGLARLLVTAGLLGILTIGDGFIYLILQDRESFAVQWFPLLYVGTNAAFLLFAVPLGRLADRWGRVPVFLAGHLALLACYLLAAVPFGGLGATVGCLILLGVFYAATDGVLAALVSQLSPPEKVGTALGAAQTVVALSRMAAAAGFGVLWFAIGPVTAVVCVAVLLVAALGAATVLMRGITTSAAAS
ncbi:MFS transporter [Arthrobacter sp. CDRTa11]|uniref:MFS transporter n=1 Tax=Arthrobacter sp. CDRTa11 TaxID=2651199 RepID=UPI002265F183|nr:MFS transporter [Arthrobacter sp. CDRTa11]